MANNIYSSFQLHGVRIKDLSIKNPLVSLSQHDIECSLSINNEDINIQETEAELSSTLTQNLTITACEKGDAALLKITLSIEGFFTTSDKNKDLFKSMLLLNGNASLYSIARSHVITLSALSLNSGNVVLPMVNFYDLLKSKRS